MDSKRGPSSRVRGERAGPSVPLQRRGGSLAGDAPSLVSSGPSPRPWGYRGMWTLQPSGQQELG